MSSGPHQNAPAFSIQQATAEQAPLIEQLINEVDISPKGLDWRRFLVAVAPSKEFIGCGQIKVHTDGTQELASIAVKQSWRGRGVARAIIDQLLARQTGAEIYLMTESGLQPFYEKFGFVLISEADMPKYFRRMAKLPVFSAGFSMGGVQMIVMKRPESE